MIAYASDNDSTTGSSYTAIWIYHEDYNNVTSSGTATYSNDTVFSDAYFDDAPATLRFKSPPPLTVKSERFELKKIVSQPATVPHFNRRILRCNRKGIGLRIGWVK